MNFTPLKMCEILNVITVLCGLVCFSTSIFLPKQSWDHELWLGKNGEMRVFWKLYPEYFEMEMRGNTSGYLAVGFSPNGGMKGADIVIGWVLENGKVILQDRHGIGNVAPVIDEHQDYKLIGGYENDGQTVIRFQRPWNTCDHELELDFWNNTVRLIWAYHMSDPVDQLPDHGNYELIWHGPTNRGARSVHFNKKDMPRVLMTADVKTWDITVDKHVIPRHRETIYWCKIIKIPKLDRKHHVIGYTPLLQDENKANIHHMLLYECRDSFSKVDHFEKYLEHDGAECYTSQMPVDWNNCLGYYAMYVAGGEGETYPQEFGLPLGEEFGGPTYLMFEIHYDNAAGKEIVDSSGIKLYYTDVLRQYDGGNLGWGQRPVPLSVVPPKQKSFTWNSFCPGECTQTSIPGDGIKVYAVYLHAHKAARKIRSRIIRNGKEITPLAVDNNYDFNYQNARIVGPKSAEKIIMPGDELLTECDYDTSQEKNMIFGGAATSEEMCQTFIIYYPRIDLARCFSTLSLSSLFGEMGIKEIEGLDSLKITIDKALSGSPDRRNKRSQIINTQADDVWKSLHVQEPLKYRGMSVFDVLHSMNWTNKEFVKNLEDGWGPNANYETWCSNNVDKNANITEQPLYTSRYPFSKFEEQHTETISTTCFDEETKSLSTANSRKFSICIINAILFYVVVFTCNYCF